MRNQSASNSSIAIIGAGMAGLAAARRLREAGFTATVFEKSRSLAGRCSSRLWQGHVVDSGAQYFTASSPEFSAFLESLGNCIQPLTAPIEVPGGELFADSPHGPRLYHTEGNNRLGKALGKDLDIRLEATVERIEASGDSSWRVLDQEFSAILCTAPLPQAATITGLPLAFAEFVPCLTALVELEGEPRELGECATRYGLLDAAPLPEEPVAWSACENHKLNRVQPGKTVMVVQAADAFSREHLEEPAEVWVPLLANRVSELWELPSSKRTSVWGHRWRYARALDEGRDTPPELPAGLFLAGDSLTRSRVEAAYLDGIRAADEIAQFLSRG